MASRILHVQVGLANVNGLPEDVSVNTFTFNEYDDTSSDVGDLGLFLNTFYDTIGVQIGSSVSRVANTSTIKVYDVTAELDGGGLGAPIHTDTFAPVAPTAGDSLPHECAVAVTLLGNNRANVPVEVPDNAGSDPDDPDTARDRPMQRRTGRIYLGPLTKQACGLDGRVTLAFQQLVRDAAVALRDGLVAQGFEWGVWSRKNASFYYLDGLWVDNAFDTQRRRGMSPTNRQLADFT